MSENLYYIFSGKTALAGNLMFWKENRAGYSPVMSEFGKYTEEEAKKICEHSTRANAYRCEDVEKISRKALIFEDFLSKITPVFEPGLKLSSNE